MKLKTLTNTRHKDSSRKESYMLIMLMNMDIKILSKISKKSNPYIEMCHERVTFPLEMKSRKIYQ